MEADRTRVAAYVLCRDGEGRILLTRWFAEGHPRSGRWTMPGGGMDWGEQPEQTAVRELREETALAVDLGGVLAVRSEWIGPDESHLGDRFHAVQIVYEGTNPRGELRTDFGDGGTTDAAGWFTLDEVRALDRVELVELCLGLCE